LNECRRQWCVSFDELLAEARGAAPLRSLIDVDDPPFAVPGDMPNRVREFCASSGQEVPADRGAIARCILESLALKHRRAVDLLSQATGTAPPVVHLVGGGARNELLAQLTANALELPLVAGPVEATAIGNLVVQAMALGELATLEEAREVVARSFDQLTYEPADAEVWREARERFEQLVPVEAPTAEVRS
jgi:rhamnulokinase